MDERRVWLTGGSAGIGAHLARDLIDRGYEVVSFARRRTPFSDPALTSVVVDLSDPRASREAFAEAAVGHPATRVVHNAGAIREKPLEAVSVDDMETLNHLHIGCAIAMVQASLPLMRARGAGRIVLVSTRAIVGLEKRTVYSATKAGLIGMGRTWALELAGAGVTVNMVAPGAIEDTEMFHDVVPKGSDLESRVAERIPVGRIGRPSDVARAVNFFLDDAADFVTGQTLFVCGGSSVGSMSFT